MNAYVVLFSLRFKDNNLYRVANPFSDFLVDLGDCLRPDTARAQKCIQDCLLKELFFANKGSALYFFGFQLLVFQFHGQCWVQ